MAQSAPALKVDNSSYVSSPIELLKLSSKAVRINLGTAVMVVLATIVAVTALALLYWALASQGTLNLAATLLVIPVILLGTAMSLGTTFAVIMLHSARGERLNFQQAWAYVGSHGWRILAVSLLAGIAIGIGIIALIIPGLLFAAWFSLAPYAVLEENLQPIAALKRSQKLVSGHVIEMWGIFGLTSAAGVVLSIVPVLGPLAALVLGVLNAPATAIRYLQLKQLKDSGTPAPPIDVWNYIVIAVLLFGGVIVRPLTNVYFPGVPYFRSGS